jgi:hypothetical protein
MLRADCRALRQAEPASESSANKEKTYLARLLAKGVPLSIGLRTDSKNAEADRRSIADTLSGRQHETVASLSQFHRKLANEGRLPVSMHLQLRLAEESRNDALRDLGPPAKTEEDVILVRSMDSPSIYDTELPVRDQVLLGSALRATATWVITYSRARVDHLALAPERPISIEWMRYTGFDIGIGLKAEQREKVVAVRFDCKEFSKQYANQSSVVSTRKIRADLASEDTGKKRLTKRGKTSRSELAASPANSARWPRYSAVLAGANEVRITNPNEFTVKVGLRSSGKGKDLTVPASSTRSVYVPDGPYEIFFQYSSEPDSLYQGDRFTLAGNGVEIQIVKVVNGNYGIRKVK